MIGFGQQTYVPDDNFEQILINLGYDNVLDDYVNTSYIDTVTSLYVSYSFISDLTGTEDFISLKFIVVYEKNLKGSNCSNISCCIFCSTS